LGFWLCRRSWSIHSHVVRAVIFHSHHSVLSVVDIMECPNTWTNLWDIERDSLLLLREVGIWTTATFFNALAASFSSFAVTGTLFYQLSLQLWSRLFQKLSWNVEMCEWVEDNDNIRGLAYLLFIVSAVIAGSRIALAEVTWKPIIAFHFFYHQLVCYIY